MLCRADLFWRISSTQCLVDGRLIGRQLGRSWFAWPFGDAHCQRDDPVVIADEGCSASRMNSQLAKLGAGGVFSRLCPAGHEKASVQFVVECLNEYFRHENCVGAFVWLVRRPNRCKPVRWRVPIVDLLP